MVFGIFTLILVAKCPCALHGDEVQTLDTLTLLLHLRMDVEVKRQIDRRMTKQFADRLAVAARLDTARCEGVTERVKPNMREIVPGKETVVELTIRADFRTLNISANEIALRIFLAKPFQYRGSP